MNADAATAPSERELHARTPSGNCLQDRTDGECERFREVVSPFLRDAHALALRLTGCRADAEDVVQQACLQAFRGIAGFAHGNARAWFLTIVRHVAFDWVRRRVVTFSLDEIDPGAHASLHMVSDDPEVELLARDEATQLRRALGSLPEPYRETLMMREFRGLTYRMIADTMRVPVGTVMSRLSRARRWLAASMGSLGPQRAYR